MLHHSFIFFGIGHRKASLKKNNLEQITWVTGVVILYVSLESPTERYITLSVLTGRRTEPRRGKRIVNVLIGLHRLLGVF